MDLAEVLLIAFALAMDAFAVALSTGAYLVRVNVRQTFRLVFHFGLFQFFMPILGWVAGAQLLRFMSAFDHWIAFALLAFIGGRMIASAFQTREDAIRGDVTRGMSLVALSVATSIDALAVGLSLAVIDTPIVFPSLVIGVIAALMTFLGLRLGERFSAAFGKRMEFAGGVILVCIGAKILFEHLV
ncbi:MAG: manganese efflux pump [Ignavibacteria bacterium]|nr:manganese efflux pump [Ignavibacteria bacterium]